MKSTSSGFTKVWLVKRHVTKRNMLLFTTTRCLLLFIFFVFGVINQDWDLPFLPLCTNAYLDTWHHSDHCAGSYSCPILSYSPTRIEHACWVSTEVAFQTFAHLSLTIAFVTFMWEQETGNQSLSFLNIRFLKFLSCTMDLPWNCLFLIHLHSFDG